MDSASIMTDILKLSPAERLRLLGEIWESITAIPEALELTDAQRRLLDERLASYERDPKACIPWNQLKSELLRQR